MAVYFDTSAFDQLYRKVGCTGADIAGLRKLIYGRELSILLSIHTLAEILLDSRTRPEAKVARIKLTLSLGNFRRMVKSCPQMIIDDIRSWASTGEAARPYIAANLQNILSEGIAGLIESDGEELDDEMMDALQGVRESMPEFEATLAQPSGKSATPQTETLLENLARYAGALETCRSRGITGLLQFRSIRAVLAASSSDRADTHWVPHLICASVADTLVTGDSELVAGMNSYSSNETEVMSLADFIRETLNG